MTGARRALAALAASFAVYLTPLVGPHAAWLLGERLWREVARGSPGRGGPDPRWVATDVAAALAAQLALLAIVFWFLGRPGWRRGVVLVAPVVPAVVALNYLYMVAIPTRFLLEADTAPERAGWPRACAVRGAALPAIGGPISGAGGGPIWVLEAAPPMRYGLLDGATCAVRWLDLAQSGLGAVTYAAGGRALYVTTAPATGRQQWSVVDVGGGRRTPLEVDAGQSPILSSDGRWAAWLRPVPGATPPIQLAAVLRPLDGGPDRVVPLDALGAGSVQVVEVDVAGAALVVARGLAELSVLDLAGRLRERLPVPGDLAVQPQTYRRVGSGWVAWDAYREDGAYRVAWSLPGGAGAHRLPLGRSVTALAPSADGRWIALSATSTLSIGSTPDSVYVLRAADGSEAFRRYLPKYTRAGVAFAGPDRLAYSDLEGVAVLRIE